MSDSNDSNSMLYIITVVASIGALGFSWYTISAIQPNKMARVGVDSKLSQRVELLIPIFVSYLPSALMWMGFFLTILAYNSAFMIPTAASAVAVPLVLIADLLYTSLTKA